MDRPEIVAAIRSSLFATRGMRRGYDVEAVDDALDDLIARIDAGDPAEDIERFVLDLAFPSRLGGYDEVPVDDLLDHVIAALHGRARAIGLAPSPPSSSGERTAPAQHDRSRTHESAQQHPQQGSALIAPRTGLLARFFGR